MFFIFRISVWSGAEPVEPVGGQVHWQTTLALEDGRPNICALRDNQHNFDIDQISKTLHGPKDFNQDSELIIFNCWSWLNIRRTGIQNLKNQSWKPLSISVGLDFLKCVQILVLEERKMWTRFKKSRRTEIVGGFRLRKLISSYWHSQFITKNNAPV